MLLKIFMFLLLAAECKAKGDLYCDFKKDMCNWSNLYGCQFKQETQTSLAGKTGYLQITKNTCNLAAISVSMKSEDPRFGFYYFLNGTGRADITVYGVFTFTGRKVIWQCSANQGPKWNMAEILIKPSFFNALKQVIIEVNILDDVTVAIGRVESPQHGRSDSRCPPSPVVVKPTTTRPITKRPPIQITTPAKPRNHTICSFEVDLCQWKDIDHECHFNHVKDTPLLGETGYLMLSKDTCKQASLLVRLKESEFQLHYLMNGTGNMKLTLGMQYGFAGKDPLWSCSASQGPQWQKVDIKTNLIHFDPIINVYIEASVEGDAVIAIGNIAKFGGGSTENQCPGNSPNHPTTRNVRIVTDAIPEWRTSPPKPNRPTSGDVHIVTDNFPHDRMTPNNPNDPTSGDVIDISDAYPASDALNGDFSPMVLQQGSKSKNGSTIGGSVVGVILVVAVVVLGMFMYRRKMRMWNIQSSTANEIESADIGFDNPLYRRQ